MNILLVDDDATSRALLTAAMAGPGRGVLAAEDGARAWELYERERVHVVVSDWRMPKMDGLELCRRLRDDEHAYHQMESYFEKHAGVLFSHGICPDCFAKQLPESSGEASPTKAV